MNDDDLLAPSLADAARPGARRRPWRLASQFWVAFFGGPLGVATIAWLNARRLELDRRARLAIAATGVAGLLVGVALALALRAADLASGARLATQAAGVLAYGILYRIQKPGDRVYAFYGTREEDYDSLLGPGIAAVVGLGIPTVVGLGLVAEAG